MRNGLDQQYRAVASGYWPLIRYDPMARAAGGNPFLLDSPRPRIPLADYTNRELRYRTLANTDPAEAERLHGLAEQAVAQRWEVYEEMATRGAHALPGRRAQGRLMDLVDRATWASRCATRSSRRRRRCRRPSTACGGWPTPASARSCSTRSSRSSCAARRR